MSPFHVEPPIRMTAEEYIVKAEACIDTARRGLAPELNLSAAQTYATVAQVRAALDGQIATIALRRIHEHLSGREWHAEDLDVVAQVLVDAGYVIEPPS